MRSKAPLALLVAAALAAACSGGSHKAKPSPTPSPTASPTPSATATATPPSTVDPLTGLARVAGAHVVAVKVDNASLARPYQRGLKQAAVVYQELVEGGSTRFLAVFESSAATSEVGPIRSARESDIDILRGFGRPALAFSGAQKGVLALIRVAAGKGYVIDGSYDSAPGLYRLGERRRDARNFFAVPSKVGARLGGSAPKDIGLRFGPLVPGVATPRARIVFSTSSTIQASFNASSHLWTLSQGNRLIPMSPANVIVQYVTTKASRFHDITGKNSPLTISTGGGSAVILRDGQRTVGTWSRAPGFGITHYRDAKGADVALRPGPTWIFLLPRSSGSVSYR